MSSQRNDGRLDRLGEHGCPVGDSVGQGRVRRQGVEPDGSQGCSTRGGRSFRRSDNPRPRGSRCRLQHGEHVPQTWSRSCSIPTRDCSPARTWPKVVVDSSTVSVEISQKVRDAAEARGVRFFAAPVSGNGKVVAAGKLSIVCSGDEETFELCASDDRIPPAAR